MIRINLEDTYEPTYVSEDLKVFIFQSDLKDGTKVDIHLLISKHPDAHLPNVYNLGFGPLNGKSEIDDTIKLNHLNSSKVFSTALLLGITFLQENS